MLRCFADHVPSEYVLREYPAVCIKGGDTKTYRVIIVLISDLLEHVDAGFPACRGLDLDSLTVNNAIGLSVAT